MPDLMPLRFLLATVAGFVNREQTRTIAYLVEENRVLREQIGERRMRLLPVVDATDPLMEASSDTMRWD